MIAEISESLVDYKTWSEYEYNEKLTHSLLSLLCSRTFRVCWRRSQGRAQTHQRLEADRRYYLRYVRSDPNFEGFQSKAEPAFRLLRDLWRSFRFRMHKRWTNTLRRFSMPVTRIAGT